MEMIQLMGTPSVNRQAFGTVGMTTDQAVVSEKTLAEFGEVLNAALSGGQEKEVNLDELIAQLVGLDLLPGMKPIHGMEGGAPQFDLSWGRIEAAARGALDDVVIPEAVTQFDFSVGNFDAQETLQGLAAWLTGQKGVAQEVFVSGDQEFVAQQTALDIQFPETDLKVSPLISGNTNATNGSREISGTNGDRSGQYRLEPGLRFEPYVDEVDPGANGAKIGFQGTGQGRREDGVTTWLSPISELKRLVNAGAPTVKLEELKEKLASLLESGRIVDPTTAQRVRDAIDFISQSLKEESGVQPILVTGKKSVQPLGFESVQASDGMVPLELKDGKLVAFEGLGLSKGELAKPAVTERTLPAPVVMAQDIIEGTSGRLTRESVASQPVVTQGIAQAVVQVGGQQAQVNKSSQETSVDFVSESDSASFVTGQFPLDGESKSFVKTVEPAEKLLPSIASKNGSLETFGSLTDLTPEVVTGEEIVQLDGSGEVSREDVGMKVDSGVVDEITAKPEAKAETAVNQARQKLIDTTLDLIAARRPQSVSIQLTPQDLGTIEVSVRSVIGRVDVDLRATDEGVRQSLATQRYDLIQSIETRGTTVTSMNVGAHLGQAADQSGNQGQGQASQQDFRQAANLGQFSNGAEAPVTTSSSYAKVGSGRVDLAA
jgi:hypothetical protein